MKLYLAALATAFALPVAAQSPSAPEMPDARAETARLQVKAATPAPAVTAQVAPAKKAVKKKKPTKQVAKRSTKPRATPKAGTAAG